ncbi:extracellular solute-binding protein [Microbacterium sp. W1N]|uniref:ABC transporter substrate-binding protein n=1 Tax=Microbacterium festucae TaxID=2977531 RepID=UPI0021C010AD|nr:extracellular solute-binding protein [Microbacterium festucae]MCT9819178.1 extracellular solute-binding protein [Microbacterium festucae]
MKHTARFLGIAAVGALAVGALAGCTGSGQGDDAGSGPVSLNIAWWGNDTRAAMYEEAIALFEESHPGITVDGTFGDFSSYWDARSTESAARNLPDVLQFDQANLVEYGLNGALLDLSPYLGDQIDVSGMEDVVVDAATVDGTQYGVPVGTGTLGLFVNPAVLAQTGVEPLDPDYTWDDLNDWITEVTDAGATTPDGKSVFGGYDQGVTMWFFIQWLLQQGQEPFEDDGSFAFTKDDMIEFLDATTPLREAASYYPPSRATEIAPADGFAIGETASSLTWDSFFSRYTDVEGLETLPVPTGPEGEKAVFYTVLHMGASANTDHPEEAALLLDFLATDPGVAEIFGTSRGIPTDAAVLDGLEFPEGSLEAKSIAYRDSLAQYETVATPVLPPTFASLESTWVRLNEDLMYGTIDVAQFVDQWWAEAEAIS